MMLGVVLVFVLFLVRVTATVFAIEKEDKD